MHTGDLIVEYQGVGDDGAGHAAGLEHVGHSQQSGYFIRDAGAGLVYFVKELGRAVDALLQRGRCPVDGVLRDGDEAHHVGQVFDGAVEPAGIGKAAGAAVLGKDAV